MIIFLIVLGFNIFMLMNIGIGDYIEAHRFKYHGRLAIFMWFYWAWGIAHLWAYLMDGDSPLYMLYKWIIN